MAARPSRAVVAASSVLVIVVSVARARSGEAAAAAPMLGSSCRMLQRRGWLLARRYLGTPHPMKLRAVGEEEAEISPAAEVVGALTRMAAVEAALVVGRARQRMEEEELGSSEWTGLSCSRVFERLAVGVASSLWEAVGPLLFSDLLLRDGWLSLVLLAVLGYQVLHLEVVWEQKLWVVLVPKTGMTLGRISMMRLGLLQCLHPHRSSSILAFPQRTIHPAGGRPLLELPVHLDRPGHCCSSLCSQAQVVLDLRAASISRVLVVLLPAATDPARRIPFQLLVRIDRS